MKKILNYLNSKKIVPKKKAHFYLIWVSKFIRFSKDKPVDQINDDDFNQFINELSKNYQQWQVDQAAQAIQAPGSAGRISSLPASSPGSGPSPMP